MKLISEKLWYYIPLRTKYYSGDTEVNPGFHQSLQATSLKWAANNSPFTTSVAKISALYNLIID
jgi:hypothetical protein